MSEAVGHLLSGPLVGRIGWALVHFLWQGALVAAALVVLLRLLRRRSSHVRWLAGCAALGLMAALPVATACLVSAEAGAPGAASVNQEEVAATGNLAAGMAADSAGARPGPGDGGPEADDGLSGRRAKPASSLAAPAAGAPTWREQADQLLRPAMPWVCLLWLLGVATMAAWHLGGWLQLHRIRRLGTQSVGAEVEAVFRRLVQRLRVSRPVRLVKSALVKVPAVVGWLRPVILLPAAALTGLTPEQLEAVLAHELGHVRRYDCLVKLLQALVTTLLFYHPAVWWISRRIDEESENCCDELALAVCGDRVSYAEALTALAASGLRQRRLAAAASGGKLLPRVRRILGFEPARGEPLCSWMTVSLVLAMLLAMGVMLWSGQVQGEAAPVLPQRQVDEMFNAAFAGKVEVVRELLAAAPRLANAKQEKTGNTPLHQAAGSGRADVVKVLLEAGADARAVNNHGETPLHYAAPSGYVEIAQLLLDRGAAVDATNERGETPLASAALHGQKAMAELLIVRGAKVNVADSRGGTLLQAAAGLGHSELVQLLVSKGAKLDIHAAAAMGLVDKVKAFIESDRKLLKATAFYGRTPLHMAAYAGRKDVVEVLLDLGADISARAEGGRTPLACAAYRGQTAVVEQLLSRGADIKATSDNGWTALHEAAAETTGTLETVKLLVSKGAEVNAKDESGRAPLHLDPKPEIAEFLLANGAEVNVSDKDGATPLHRAALSGHAELVRVLLKHGADAKAKDGNGQTPLEAAMMMLRSFEQAVAQGAADESATQALDAAREAVLALKGDSAAARTMELRVLDGADQRPVAGAAVLASVNGATESLETDAEGRCAITIPGGDIATFNVSAKKAKFVPVRVTWRDKDRQAALPEQYTLTLEPGTTIGGLVKDDRGRPLEGAGVGVLIRVSRDGPGGELIKVEPEPPVAPTDAEGRWRCAGVPAELSDFALHFSHPDCISDRAWRSRQILPPIEDFRKMTALITLTRGVKVKGRVVDSGGQPVAGAKVGEGKFSWSNLFSETSTDAEGRFEFKPLNSGACNFSVQAEGFAPDMQQVAVVEGLAPVEFRLEPGHLLKVRVVDRQGQPAEGVNVTIAKWRGEDCLRWSRKTDAEGRFQWTGAPADEVTFNFKKEGLMSQAVTLTAGLQEHTVKMAPPLRVTGSVVDAETSRPVEQFTVIVGYCWSANSPVSWANGGALKCTGGKFEVTLDPFKLPGVNFANPILDPRVRIQAEGYLPVDSRLLGFDEGDVALDFRLTKGAGYSALVRGPDGKPVAGAKAIRAPKGRNVYIQNGNVASRQGYETVETGPDGRFTLPAMDEPFGYCVLADQGYAFVTKTQAPQTSEVTLTAWGRVEGTLRVGAKPGAGERVDFYADERDTEGLVLLDYSSRVDAAGRFVCERMPALKFRAGRYITVRKFQDGEMGGASALVPVVVQPGKTTTLALGGVGRPVIGRAATPPEIKEPVEWLDSDLQLRVPGQPLSDEMDWQEHSELRADPEKYAQFIDSQRRYSVVVKEDGTFRVEDVPAGAYRLTLEARKMSDPNKPQEGQLLARLVTEITVPEMPGGRSDEPLDFGLLTAPAVDGSAPPPPRRRPLPSLAGKELPTLDGLGLDVKPDALKGKPVLVCFWDYAQRPSRHAVEQLVARAAELERQGVVVVSIRAAGADEKQLKAWLEKTGPKFPMGVLAEKPEEQRSRWCVRGWPWLILTDRQGVVRAEGFALEELDARIKMLSAPPEPRPRLKGTVLDNGGKPVERATVELLPSAGQRIVLTDAMGKFEFLLDESDMRCFEPENSPDIKGILLVVHHAERNLAGTAEVLDPSESLEVRLEAGLTLKGRVIEEGGKPLPGAEVRLQFWAPRITGAALLAKTFEARVTDADGRYQFQAVPPRQYYIPVITCEGHSSSRPGVDLRHVAGDEFTVPDAALEVANLSLSGVVVDVQGEPVPRAFVVAESGIYHEFTERADEAGRFSFRGLYKSRRPWNIAAYPPGGDGSGKAGGHIEVDVQQDVHDLNIVMETKYRAADSAAPAPAAEASSLPEGGKGFDAAAFSQLSQEKKAALVLAALQGREAQLRNFSYKMVASSRNVSAKTGAELRVWERDAFNLKRKGDKLLLHNVRSREGRDEGEFFASWDGATARSLTHRPEYTNPRGLIWGEEPNLLSYYKYNAVLGLRVRAGRMDQAVSTVEWLQQAVADGGPIDIELTDMDGRKVVTVKISSGASGLHWKYAFDPGRGFMAVLAEYGSDRLERYSYEITRTVGATEVAGLWVPTKVVCRSGNAGQDEETELTYEISEFTRGGVADKDLEITFPAGTEVYDSFKKEAYRVLPGGARVILPSGKFTPEQPQSLLGRELWPLHVLGLNVTPETFKDKSILLCFWDNGQRPSRQCLSELAAKAAELEQRGMAVVAMRIGEAGDAQATAWLEKLGPKFTMGAIAKQPESWGIRGLPWLILTDAKHVVQAEGFAVSDLDRLISKLVEPAAAQAPDKTGGAASAPTPAQAEGADLVTYGGNVVDDQGQPVAGARVDVLPYAPGRPAVTTDAQGRFQAQAGGLAGHLASGLQVCLLVRQLERNLAAAVMLDEVRRRVEVKLRPAVALLGQVVDDQDKPLAGIPVSLMLWVWPDHWCATVPDCGVKTDGQGRYELKCLPTGRTYDVCLNRDYELGTTGVSGARITVAVDSSQWNCVKVDKVTLRPTNCAVSGTVVDADGKPVAGATVTAEGEAGSPPRHTKSDGQGRFKIDKLCKGTFRLYAVAGPDVPRKEVQIDVAGDVKDITLSTAPANEAAALPAPKEPASLVGKPLLDLRGLGLDLEPQTFKDKMVLMCFWDYGQRPSRHAVEQLVARAGELQKSGVAVILVRAAAADEQQVKAWLEKTGPKFPMAVLAGKPDEQLSRWGVRGWPWLILTDAKHVVQAEGFGLDEFDPANPGATVSWRKSFYELYRLEDGEVLKRIAPPFIPERAEYYRKEDSFQASAVPEPPTRYVFYWDGELGKGGLAFMPTPTLGNTLRHVLGLDSYDFEGPDELLQLKLPGDWILRKDSPREARLEALAKLLKDELGRSVRFQKQQVERETIVAEGKFEFHPLPGAPDGKAVQMFSDVVDPDQGGGGGTGTPSQFLDRLGDLVSRRVINNVQSPDGLEFFWLHHRSAYLAKAGQPVDEKKLDLLLENIAKQTSLKFTKERRMVDVWLLSEEQPSRP